MTKSRMIVSSPRIKQVTHVAVKLTSQEIIIIRNNDFRYCFTLFPKCLDTKWQHGNTTQNIRLSLALSCITTTSQEQLNLNWAQLWSNWRMNDFWFVTFSICKTGIITWDLRSVPWKSSKDFLYATRTQLILVNNCLSWSFSQIFLSFRARRFH